jgi:hypothetical protein
MSMFNFRIGGRLYAGFGALVLFGAVLAGFGVWQLWGIQNQVEAMKVQSENAVRIGEITTELQGIRRAFQRYAFDQDEASLAEADKRSTKTSELLEEAARTTTSPKNRASYGEGVKQVAELRAKGIALGAAVKQMLAGRSLLFTDGDAMAADVQKFVDSAEKTDFAGRASALETKVLLVRDANWRTAMPRVLLHSRLI